MGITTHDKCNENIEGNIFCECILNYMVYIWSSKENDSEMNENINNLKNQILYNKENEI